MQISVGSYAPGDYLDFRTNVTVYAYRSQYGQSGYDTAVYIVNSDVITATETGGADLLFVEQDSTGHISTPTKIQIMAMTDHLLVLNFPIRASVRASIPTVYYPGTLTDKLMR